MTLELWLLKFQKVKQNEEKGERDSPFEGFHTHKTQVTLDNFSCNLSLNFVAAQVATQIAQCNIPCHKHSTQHFCCRHRCKKYKSIILWARNAFRNAATSFSIIECSVTSVLQLVSQRFAAPAN